MKDIRIAAVICNSLAAKTRHNLDGMVKWIRASKNEGAAVVCFPEMNVTGYSNLAGIKDSAEPVPGTVTRDLLHLAESERIIILAGVVERDDEGRIFASHLVLTPDGFCGVYRKLHIAPPERSVFTPGDDIPVFAAEGVRFGIQLCYDAHFPELSTCMALKGADLIFIPHASPRGTPAEKYRSWMRHLPARAYDNSVFVIACNQTGDNKKGLNFPGIAMVIGPSGEVLQKDVSGREGVIVAELKAEDLDRVRNHRMRFFLPNRRPELYHL
ncbi:MAG: nitrilase-related carbon-nitrogen hydrolase [Pseudomonadota bacterium]|uniref:Nitrilase n=1 Tax=Candidatus Desulfatibia profunda TaxID=2841695 RepID=A0A8J6TMN2_9BACT|nr:nitrilase [Candidatus Desulfatibia profunda]MBL7180173.1 nitrilase [Desulfobacterales bacterium]